MMRMVLKKPDAVIAVSESTKRDILARFRVDPARVYAIAEAVHGRYKPFVKGAALADACARFGVTPGKYLFNVGVLEPRKNIPGLLDAYKILMDKGHRMPLLIAGKKGWLYDDIFAKVKKNGLEDSVRFAGFVPEADLPYLYNGARCFVYPSLYEGFGLPLLEAISCGTPVICSNISSMPEVVGDAGLLVPPGDAAALSAAMEQLITNDALRADLHERALRRAAEFSWSKTARETRELYERIAR
ncbi:MAG: glycosyltransferase family 1 protein, partial [Chitinivibrionales bacterium]|nr:glycosyltransferase family 1 protein [Chitinivibrionales bacterium]